MTQANANNAFIMSVKYFESSAKQTTEWRVVNTHVIERLDVTILQIDLDQNVRMATNANDLKGILCLVLLITTSVTSTNIDCNGKPFHCMNSTHFLICVDLGNGISITIDDFVIPCPPMTFCQRTNRFECEFPIISTTVAPLDVTHAKQDTTTVETITTVKEPTTTDQTIDTTDFTTIKNYVNNSPQGNDTVSITISPKVTHSTVVPYRPINYDIVKEITTTDVSRSKILPEEIEDVQMKSSTHESIYFPNDYLAEQPIIENVMVKPMLDPMLPDIETDKNKNLTETSADIILSKINKTNDNPQVSEKSKVLHPADFGNSSGQVLNDTTLTSNKKFTHELDTANTFATNLSLHNLTDMKVKEHEIFASDLNYDPKLTVNFTATELIIILNTTEVPTSDSIPRDHLDPLPSINGTTHSNETISLLNLSNVSSINQVNEYVIETKEVSSFVSNDRQLTLPITTLTEENQHINHTTSNKLLDTSQVSNFILSKNETLSTMTIENNIFHNQHDAALQEVNEKSSSDSLTLRPTLETVIVDHDTLVYNDNLLNISDILIITNESLQDQNFTETYSRGNISSYVPQMQLNSTSKINDIFDFEPTSEPVLTSTMYTSDTKLINKSNITYNETSIDNNLKPDFILATESSTASEQITKLNTTQNTLNNEIQNNMTHFIDNNLKNNLNDQILPLNLESVSSFEPVIIDNDSFDSVQLSNLTKTSKIMNTSKLKLPNFNDTLAVTFASETATDSMSTLIESYSNNFSDSRISSNQYVPYYNSTNITLQDHNKVSEYLNSQVQLVEISLPTNQPISILNNSKQFTKYTTPFLNDKNESIQMDISSIGQFNINNSKHSNESFNEAINVVNATENTNIVDKEFQLAKENLTTFEGNTLIVESTDATDLTTTILDSSYSITNRTTVLNNTLFPNSSNLHRHNKNESMQVDNSSILQINNNNLNEQLLNHTLSAFKNEGELIDIINTTENPYTVDKYLRNSTILSNFESSTLSVQSESTTEPTTIGRTLNKIASPNFQELLFSTPNETLSAESTTTTEIIIIANTAQLNITKMFVNTSRSMNTNESVQLHTSNHNVIKTKPEQYISVNSNINAPILFDKTKLIITTDYNLNQKSQISSENSTRNTNKSDNFEQTYTKHNINFINNQNSTLNNNFLPILKPTIQEDKVRNTTNLGWIHAKEEEILSSLLERTTADNNMLTYEKSTMQNYTDDQNEAAKLSLNMSSSFQPIELHNTNISANNVNKSNDKVNIYENNILVNSSYNVDDINSKETEIAKLIPVLLETTTPQSNIELHKQYYSENIKNLDLSLKETETRNSLKIIETHSVPSLQNESAKSNSKITAYTVAEETTEKSISIDLENGTLKNNVSNSIKEFTIPNENNMTLLNSAIMQNPPRIINSVSLSKGIEASFSTMTGYDDSTVGEPDPIIVITTVDNASTAAVPLVTQKIYSTTVPPKTNVISIREINHVTISHNKNLTENSSSIVDITDVYENQEIYTNITHDSVSLNDMNDGRNERIAVSTGTNSTIVTFIGNVTHDLVIKGTNELSNSSLLIDVPSFNSSTGKTSAILSSLADNISHIIVLKTNLSNVPSEFSPNYDNNTQGIISDSIEKALLSAHDRLEGDIRSNKTDLNQSSSREDLNNTTPVTLMETIPQVLSKRANLSHVVVKKNISTAVNDSTGLQSTLEQTKAILTIPVNKPTSVNNKKYTSDTLNISVNKLESRYPMLNNSATHIEFNNDEIKRNNVTFSTGINASVLVVTDKLDKSIDKIPFTTAPRTNSNIPDPVINSSVVAENNIQNETFVDKNQLNATRIEISRLNSNLNINKTGDNHTIEINNPSDNLKNTSQITDIPNGPATISSNDSNYSDMKHVSNSVGNVLKLNQSYVDILSKHPNTEYTVPTKETIIASRSIYNNTEILIDSSRSENFTSIEGSTYKTEVYDHINNPSGRVTAYNFNISSYEENNKTISDNNKILHNTTNTSAPTAVKNDTKLMVLLSVENQNNKVSSTIEKTTKHALNITFKTEKYSKFNLSTISDQLIHKNNETNNTIKAQIKTSTASNLSNNMDYKDNRYINKSNVMNIFKTNCSISDIMNRIKYSGNFSCQKFNRGRYADIQDCKTFYICIGRTHPIVGYCPTNTVFSDFNKQCTSNLSHCVRNNQFRCSQEGRFSDFFEDNTYYICVKNSMERFKRYKLQCQNGYHLNKTALKCELDKQLALEEEEEEEPTSEDSQRTNDSNGSKSKSKEDNNFECPTQGRFSDSEDCRKYYTCSKNSKSEYRRKIKFCGSDEVFHREEQRCVDSESYECWSG